MVFVDTCILIDHSKGKISIRNIDNLIDSLWIEEARKRRDEIESGKVTTVSGDEVFRKIQESKRLLF
jgi:hypothetical protein